MAILLHVIVAAAVVPSVVRLQTLVAQMGYPHHRRKTAGALWGLALLAINHQTIVSQDRMKAQPARNSLRQYSFLTIFIDGNIDE